MNTNRKKKIESAIRKILSIFLSHQLPDNDNIFGIINIGELTMSPDGSYLDIYVSSFMQQDLLTKTLAKHAYIIQRHIGKELAMRQNPKVRFRYDASGEIWDNITKKINNLDII